MINIPAATRLMTHVRRRPRVPGTRGDTGRLSEHMVAAVGDLAQLLDGFIKAAAFGGVPHRGAVKFLLSAGVLGKPRREIRLTDLFTALSAGAAGSVPEVGARSDLKPPDLFGGRLR
jgi:hypothetical protein